MQRNVKADYHGMGSDLLLADYETNAYFKKRFHDGLDGDSKKERVIVHLNDL